MKEYEFINLIKKSVSNKYIGDDCAHLKELGIVITQDNFIENVHFKTEWATAFQIGYKATAVNISDILASGAEPAYLTLGLSLPSYINSNFVEDLYKGILKASNGAEIIGGDITGSEKIIISITAIGKTKGRRISSRSNAKAGYSVIISSKHGDSLKGYNELIEGKKDTKYIKAHLEPSLDISFSKSISTQIKSDYAMMDTSDGLADALFQIAKASNCHIKVNEIEGIYSTEDYKLVAVVPKELLPQIEYFKIIGQVYDYKGTYLTIGENHFNNHYELNLYDHFKK